MAHEGTDDTSAMSPTPQELFLKETIRAIADCVVKQLRSSTQDRDASRALELIPSPTVSQGTSGGELPVALILLIDDILCSAFLTILVPNLHSTCSQLRSIIIFVMGARNTGTLHMLHQAYKPSTYVYQHQVVITPQVERKKNKGMNDSGDSG